MLLGETDGVFGLVLSFSRNPRNSKALLPESTVVTAIENKRVLLIRQHGKQEPNKIQFFQRCWPKESTLVGRGSEEPLNEFPIDDAVIHSQDMKL